MRHRAVCWRTATAHFSDPLLCSQVAEDRAKEFVDFVNKGPSPYHGARALKLFCVSDHIGKMVADYGSSLQYPPSPAVVEECRQKLLRNGFTELNEKEAWNVKPLGKVRSGVQAHRRWRVRVQL